MKQSKMNVDKTNETFLSSNGVDRVHYFVYRPTANIKGVLQISHGMCEHIERYQDFAAFLAQNGFVVYAHDHLGHGHTAKDKEHLGYFGDKNGWQYMVEDLYQVTKLARMEYPFHKVFLLGHSMGSFITRLYMMKYGSKVDGVILSGTSGGHQLNNVGLAVVDLWIKVKGPLYRSKTKYKMLFGNYNKRYPHVNTNSDWISRDPLIVESYIKDEYNTFTFTNAGFKDLMTMLKMVSDERWAFAVPKDVPVYLFAGDMDPVGDYGTGVKKVYDRLAKAGVQNLKIKLYPEGRHEMLNEINRREVYYDVLNWMMERI